MDKATGRHPGYAYSAGWSNAAAKPVDSQRHAAGHAHHGQTQLLGRNIKESLEKRKEQRPITVA